MNTCTAIVCALLLGIFCAAQDSPPTNTNQDSNHSVAAAAAESRERVKDEDAKKADIRRLLEITGAANLASQSMDAMEKHLRPLVADSLPPGEYRDKLVELFFEKFRSKRSPDQVLAVIIPIYDKYYSDDEIKELIKLYETPIGQKMISVLPKLAAESQAAGKTWGEEIGRQSMQEVFAEHPELQAALQHAQQTAQQP